MINTNQAIFLVAFIASFVQGTVLTVGPSGAYNNISAALNAAVDHDIIQLEAQIYNGIQNRNFNLVRFANITIAGQGSGSTTIDCELADRFFYVQSSVAERNIQISGLRIFQCKVLTGILYGGAIYIKNNFTSITFNDVSFENCSASQGGAVYIEGYSGQNASLGHSAIVQMNNVNFIKNSATLLGGAIWFVRVDAVWSYGNVMNNSASSDGGAMWLEDNVNLLIDHVTFQYNSADNAGAARIDDLSTINGSYVQFLDNSASRDGGAIRAFRSFVYCTNCYASGNRGGNGGTFYFTGGGFSSFSSCTFETGHALLGGGFAQSYNAADMEYIDCTISSSSASQGGAFMVSQESYLSLVRTIVSNNSVTGGGEGGAVYLIYKSRLELIDSIIQDNIASVRGAGVWCGDSEIEVKGTSQFISNDAPADDDIHCSTIISGSFCDISGGKYADSCDPEKYEEPFKTGYIIIIAVIGGLLLIIILIAVMVAYFRRDRKQKLKTGKLWENMEETKTEDKEEKAEKGEKNASEASEAKRESKRDSKRNSKRDSKRESKKTDDSSQASLKESEQASEKKSESSDSE